MSYPTSEVESKSQQKLLIEQLDAEKDNILRNSTAKTFELPEIFKFDFDKTDHRWNKKDADITDYFNYGFNEETWKLYVNKVRKLALKLNPTEYRIESDNLQDSECLNELDDYFPIDLGGFSHPFFKDIFENLGENFFDDKILAHCVSRKKYGSFDYDNISLDNFLAHFLNFPQKSSNSQVFEKLIKVIKTKNEEHSKDIYQIKKHLKPSDKKITTMPPPWPPMFPRFPPPLGFHPFMGPQGMMPPPPFVKPPTGQIPGLMNFDFMHLNNNKFGIENGNAKIEKKIDRFENNERKEKSNNGFRDKKHDHNKEKNSRNPNTYKKKSEKLDELSEYSHSSSESDRKRRKSRENHRKHSHNTHSHWSRSFIPNYLHKKKSQENKKKKKHENSHSKSRSESRSPRSKNKRVEKEKEKKRSRSKSKKSESPEIRKKRKLEEVKPKGVISLKAKNNDFKEKI